MQCFNCYKEITPERLEGLQTLGVLNPREILCIECAEILIPKIKGVWSGETGTSELIFADSLGRNGIKKDS